MAMIRKAAGRIGLRRLLRNRENLLLLRIIRYRGMCRALLLHFFYWASLYSIQLLGRSIHEQVLQLLLELKVLSFSCLVIVFRFVQKPFCLQRGRMLDSGATQMVALNGHVILYTPQNTPTILLRVRTSQRTCFNWYVLVISVTDLCVCTYQHSPKIGKVNRSDASGDPFGRRAVRHLVGAFHV